MGVTVLSSADLLGAGPHQGSSSWPGGSSGESSVPASGAPQTFTFPSELLSQSPKVPLALLPWSCPTSPVTHLLAPDLQLTSICKNQPPPEIPESGHSQGCLALPLAPKPLPRRVSDSFFHYSPHPAHSFSTRTSDLPLPLPCVHRSSSDKPSPRHRHHPYRLIPASSEPNVKLEGKSEVNKIQSSLSA